MPRQRELRATKSTKRKLINDVNFSFEEENRGSGGETSKRPRLENTTHNSDQRTKTRKTDVISSNAVAVASPTKRLKNGNDSKHQDLNAKTEKNQDARVSHNLRRLQNNEKAAESGRRYEESRKRTTSGNKITDPTTESVRRKLVLLGLEWELLNDRNHKRQKSKVIRKETETRKEKVLQQLMKLDGEWQKLNSRLHRHPVVKLICNPDRKDSVKLDLPFRLHYSQNTLRFLSHPREPCENDDYVKIYEYRERVVQSIIICEKSISRMDSACDPIEKLFPRELKNIDNWLSKAPGLFSYYEDDDLLEFAPWWVLNMGTWLLRDDVPEIHNSTFPVLRKILGSIGDESVWAAVTDLLLTLVRFVTPLNKPDRTFNCSLHYRTHELQRANVHSLRFKVPINARTKERVVYLLQMLYRSSSKLLPSSKNTIFIIRCAKQLWFHLKDSQYRMELLQDFPIYQKKITLPVCEALLDFVFQIFCSTLFDPVNDSQIFILKQFWEEFIDFLPKLKQYPMSLLDTHMKMRQLFMDYCLYSRFVLYESSCQREMCVNVCLAVKAEAKEILGIMEDIAVADNSLFKSAIDTGRFLIYIQFNEFTKFILQEVLWNLEEVFYSVTSKASTESKIDSNSNEFPCITLTNSSKFVRHNISLKTILPCWYRAFGGLTAFLQEYHSNPFTVVTGQTTFEMDLWAVQLTSSLTCFITKLLTEFKEFVDNFNVTTNGQWEVNLELGPNTFIVHWVNCAYGLLLQFPVNGEIIVEGWCHPFTKSYILQTVMNVVECVELHWFRAVKMSNDDGFDESDALRHSLITLSMMISLPWLDTFAESILNSHMKARRKVLYKRLQSRKPMGRLGSDLMLEMRLLKQFYVGDTKNLMKPHLKANSIACLQSPIFWCYRIQIQSLFLSLLRSDSLKGDCVLLFLKIIGDASWIISTVDNFKELVDFMERILASDYIQRGDIQIQFSKALSRLPCILYAMCLRKSGFRDFEECYLPNKVCTAKHDTIVESVQLGISKLSDSHSKIKFTLLSILSMVQKFRKQIRGLRKYRRFFAAARYEVCPVPQDHNSALKHFRMYFCLGITKNQHWAALSSLSHLLLTITSHWPTVAFEFFDDFRRQLREVHDEQVFQDNISAIARAYKLLTQFSRQPTCVVRVANRLGSKLHAIYKSKIVYDQKTGLKFSPAEIIWMTRVCHLLELLIPFTDKALLPHLLGLSFLIGEQLWSPKKEASAGEHLLCMASNKYASVESMLEENSESFCEAIQNFVCGTFEKDGAAKGRTKNLNSTCSSEKTLRDSYFFSAVLPSLTGFECNLSFIQKMLPVLLKPLMKRVMENDCFATMFLKRILFLILEGNSAYQGELFVSIVPYIYVPLVNTYGIQKTETAIMKVCKSLGIEMRLSAKALKKIVREFVFCIGESAEETLLALSVAIQWYVGRTCSFAMLHKLLTVIIVRNTKNFLKMIRDLVKTQYTSENIKSVIHLLYLLGSNVVNRYSRRLFSTFTSFLKEETAEPVLKLFQAFISMLNSSNMNDLGPPIAAAALIFQHKHSNSVKRIVNITLRKSGSEIIKVQNPFGQYAKYFIFKPKVSTEDFKMADCLHIIKILVSSLCQEYFPVRYSSLILLEQFLSTAKSIFRFRILKEEPELFCKLVKALVEQCRFGIKDVRYLSIRCLAQLDAFNPEVQSKYQDPEKVSQVDYFVTGNKFIIDYIHALVEIFKEAKFLTDFELVQQTLASLLDELELSPNTQDGILPKLSTEARAIISSLPKLNIIILPKGICGNPSLELFPDLIFLSPMGMTFTDWTNNWLHSLLLTLGESGGKLARKLFECSTTLALQNPSILSFVLPPAVTYALVCGSENLREKIINEINLTIFHWLGIQRHPNSYDDETTTQALDVIATSKVEKVTQFPTNICEPSIFEHALRGPSQMCSNSSNCILCARLPLKTWTSTDIDDFQENGSRIIFRIFDHVFHTTRSVWNRQSLASSSSTFRPHLQRIEDDVVLKPSTSQILDDVLLNFSLVMLSELAFRHNEFERALMYLELHLKRKPEDISSLLGYLSRIYEALHDRDAMIGISKKEIEFELSSQRNLMLEQITTAVEAGNDDDSLVDRNGALMRSYATIDSPIKVDDFIKAFTASRPDWAPNFEEAAVKVLIDLSKWDSLESKMDTFTWEDSKLYDNSWSISVGKILIPLRNKNLSQCTQVIKTSLKQISLNVNANTGRGLSISCQDINKENILYKVLQTVEYLKPYLPYLHKPVDQQCSEEMFSRMMETFKLLVQDWVSDASSSHNGWPYTAPLIYIQKYIVDSLSEWTSPNNDIANDLRSILADCWILQGRLERKYGLSNCSKSSITEAYKVLQLEHFKENMFLRKPRLVIELAKSLSVTGHQFAAIKLLRTVLKDPSSYIPESRSPRMLLAQLCESEKAGDYDDNINSYIDACKLAPTERSYFELASYYDRIYAKGEKQFKPTNMQYLILENYAESLKYGTKFVYQSLPRLLTIWLDFHSTSEPRSKSGSSTGSGTPGSMDSQGTSLSSIKAYTSKTELMDDMKRKILDTFKFIPKYVFLTAFSQLTSRICHPIPSVWSGLKRIIGELIQNFPHQTIMQLYSLSQSTHTVRRAKCEEIFEKVVKLFPKMKELISSYTAVLNELQELAKLNEKRSSLQLSTVNTKLNSLLKHRNTNILIPFQEFLLPKLPNKDELREGLSGGPFGPLVFMVKFDEAVTVLSSLQRPKRLTVKGTNGTTYSILCKHKDDLRKDWKVMEFIHVVNVYLNKLTGIQDRKLQIRTYAVVPLSEVVGMLEWVPSTSGIRQIMSSLYKDRNLGLPGAKIRGLTCAVTDPIEKKLECYNKLLEAHPLMLSEYYYTMFSDPVSWFLARNSFTTTHAVMCIVGFILGLGDRHGENVRVNLSTGEIFHVDYNCLFNQGEALEFPEVVPFRLTPNLVEAMGCLGIEGKFRNVCETTLTMIRERESVLLSVLRPFVFDPFVDWVNNNPFRRQPKTKKGEFIEEANSNGMEQMKHIRNRITGRARNMTRKTDAELSVKAHVDLLLNEATDKKNLCQMYIGWAAYI